MEKYEIIDMLSEINERVKQIDFLTNEAQILGDNIEAIENKITTGEANTDDFISICCTDGKRVKKHLDIISTLVIDLRQYIEEEKENIKK